MNACNKLNSTLIIHLREVVKCIKCYFACQTTLTSFAIVSFVSHGHSQTTDKPGHLPSIYIAHLCSQSCKELKEDGQPPPTAPLLTFPPSLLSPADLSPLCSQDLRLLALQK